LAASSIVRCWLLRADGFFLFAMRESPDMIVAGWECSSQAFVPPLTRKHPASETFSTQHKGERCYDKESQETR
jgi:hypothetical protein